MMLTLSIICMTVAIFVCFTKTISLKRRAVLLVTELSAAFLLIADRYSYLYRGVETQTGWWVVRISNFLVYVLILVIVFTFNCYLVDLYQNTADSEVPMRLRIGEIILVTGVVLVIFSQFTGIYYTFDEHNQYQRSTYFFFSYLAEYRFYLNVICRFVIFIADIF